MDYTTLANVKQAIGATENTDDALISRLITEASRVIDRYCAGSSNSDNYLEQETITDLVIDGLGDAKGNILCHPPKPRIISVSAASYRPSPLDSWLSIAADHVQIKGSSVWLFAGASERYGLQVKLSFTGGLAAATANLPGDIVNAADLLSIRFYREIKSGVTDSIGVAELGTLQYTKALPVRVVELLKPWRMLVRI